jgi:glutamyl-tRNA synthetase
MNDAVRCRIAPAPSGFLHVGNARTALVNWLFARHNGGTFVLRVEDTDVDRVTEEGVQILERSLSWLGLQWDEGPDVGGAYGPYRQTERYDLYREAGARLLAEGHAYHCYCTPQELEERRKEAMARGETPGYDGRCRNLTEAERRAFEAEGRVPALRFAIPEGREVVVHDLIRGEGRFDPDELRDFIILRSDGSPTYLLASGLDDLLMKMTHVIRGEDLWSSTPRQMLIFEGLGEPPPRYAHLPLILGPDRAKLSKRHGAVAVEHFREEGFLPDAMVNYMALLGWSPGEDQEILPRDGLVRRFELTDVSHHPSIFDVDKLTWMNGHYIRQTDDDDLAAMLLPFFAGAGLQVEPEVLRAAVPAIKPRIQKLTEAVALLRYLFVDEVTPNEKAAKLIEKAGREYLREAARRLEAVEDWTDDEITQTLDALAQGAGMSRTKGWQPIRAAVTGTDVSPPLPESLELLGKEQTIARLRAGAGD